MRLVEICSDWTERLDALLEAYYIDTTKAKDPNDPWGDLADTKSTHRLADSEQGGVSIGNVIPQKGVVVVKLDQEALDYPAEEIAKQLQLVAAEFGGSHRALEIACEDDTLWAHVEQAVNALIKRRVLADMDDPVEGSNRHLFRINQLGPRDMEGASTTAQTTYAGKAGGLPPDLIAKIEDQLLQPFHAHAGYKNYTAPQVKRKQSGRPDDPTLMQKAVMLHRKFFGGKRWPALETALSYRANTMGQSPGGDFVRPRITSFCSYLANLTTPWPNGEKIMADFLAGHNGTEIIENQEGMRYLQKRPKLMKFVAKKVFTMLVQYPMVNIKNDMSIQGLSSLSEFGDHKPTADLEHINETVQMIQGKSQARILSAYQPFVPYMTTNMMRSVLGDDIADAIGLSETEATQQPPNDGMDRLIADLQANGGVGVFNKYDTNAVAAALAEKLARMVAKPTHNIELTRAGRAYRPAPGQVGAPVPAGTTA